MRAILCAKPDLTRLAVTLVGDVRHSGLARSLIHALTTLGVPELRVAAPPSLLPEGLPQLGVFPFSALDEGLRDADVIILLPLSAEAVAAGRLPSPRDYAAGYRLSPGAGLARSDALLLSAAGLHAGIEAEVAFDAALARAGHERDALEHALRLAALRLLSDSLGRTLAPGGAHEAAHHQRQADRSRRRRGPAGGSVHRRRPCGRRGRRASGFQADRRIEADGLAVLPGLVDLCARLAGPDGSPSPDALRAALTGGVTRLVQPPDGGVMLDDPARVHAFLNESPAGPCRIHAVGALTPGLRGEALAELRLLAQAGCLAFGQGEAGLSDTRLLWNAMRYAAGAGLALWLRPQDPWLARGARRPAAPMPRGWAWKACRTWLKRWPCKHCSNCSATPARACTCRACPAPPAGAGARGQARGPARQLRRVGQSSAPDRRGHRFLRCPLPPAAAAARDRDAIRAALADGTIDALCSDHTAVTAAGKAAPFAQAQPGAPGLATLLPLTLKWARDQRVPLAEALARVTSGPAAVLRAVAPQAPCGAAPAGMLAPARPPTFVWSTWTWNRRRIPQRCLAAAPSARSRV